MQESVAFKGNEPLIERISRTTEENGRISGTKQSGTCKTYHGYEYGCIFRKSRTLIMSLMTNQPRA
jgi:hypothetical protein